jgi:hypothetical protein
VTNRVLLQLEILNLVNGSSWFPDGMCANEGIASLKRYFWDNTMNDLNTSYDPFLAAAMHSGMDDQMLTAITTPIFTASDFLLNIHGNLTYQKQVYLFKEYVYRWLVNGRSSYLNTVYFESIFPHILLSRTFDLMQPLYGPIDAHFHDGIK